MGATTNNDQPSLREVLASRLRTARENAGLSQGQVAREMKYHRPTISEIEAGRRKVTAEELSQFSKMYGVSVEWLSATEPSTFDPVEDRLQLAARELAHLKPEDLERLLSLLKTMRKSTGTPSASTPGESNS